MGIGTAFEARREMGALANTSSAAALASLGSDLDAGTPTCVSFVDPQGSIGAKVFFNLAYGLPTLAFLGFLALRLKPALRRLVRSQSQIMRTYYSFLWVVCVLNLLRCIFQIAESSDGTSERDMKSWSFVWLVTSAGMTVMEVSVVTFLSQGYIATGKEALIRTLTISGVVALLDSIVKVSAPPPFPSQLFSRSWC